MLDGNADRDRIRRISIGESGEIAVIAIEDISPIGWGNMRPAPRAMLDQATALFRLYPDADRVYMDRRIREETAGDYGIDALDP